MIKMSDKMKNYGRKIGSKKPFISDTIDLIGFIFDFSIVLTVLISIALSNSKPPHKKCIPEYTPAEFMSLYDYTL